jgi:hypothetical protein
MTRFLRFGAALVRWLRRSRAEREAEIVYLRQQLVVLKRSAPARPKLRATDRLIFVCLYHLFLSLIDASVLFIRSVSDLGRTPNVICLLVPSVTSDRMIEAGWRFAQRLTWQSDAADDA